MSTFGIERWEAQTNGKSTCCNHRITQDAYLEGERASEECTPRLQRREKRIVPIRYEQVKVLTLSMPQVLDDALSWHHSVSLESDISIQFYSLPQKDIHQTSSLIQYIQYIQ